MKAKDIGLAIFIIVFFTVGIGFLVKGAQSWVKSRKMEQWRPATAIIESCRLVKESVEDGPLYIVEARYSYSVDGKPYTGDRIAFGYNKGYREKDHRAICDKLTNAFKVKVKYNPLKPDESVLVTGSNGSTLHTFIFAITWLSLVTGIAVLFKMTLRKDNKLLREIQVIESKAGDSNHTLNPDSGATALNPRR